jgi:hypothetical protein
MRAPPEEEIDQERRRAVVMSHEISQEHVHHVVIDSERTHGPIVIITIVGFKRLYGTERAG